jgi:cytochrome c oxidase cbb3-type subunit 3
VAFPFASGQLALDAPDDSLNDEQRRGRTLFMAACVSCHDRGRVLDTGPAWSSRPVSYPRMGFVPGDVPPPPVDAVSSASVYAKHDVPPDLRHLSPRQARGRQLFQANCAFCHGADGTGMNWIGQFMEPKARDLTQFNARTLPPERFAQVIRDGLPGSSMPAWAGVLKSDDIDAVVAYASRAFFKAPP